MLIRFKAGSLAWSAQNHDKAMAKIDKALLDMFESRKTLLTIDAVDTRPDEERCNPLIVEIIERASQQDLRIVVSTRSKHLKSSIKEKGSRNVTIWESHDPEAAFSAAQPLSSGQVNS